MFQVKFEYREDEEYGGEGWIPSAFPNFNAASGIALVHDVLEHFPEDDGDLAGEMKAFGSMINIRWLGGWQPLSSYSMFSPAENMGSDIGRFLEELSYGGNSIKRPPRTYKVEEYAECLIQEALVEGKRSYLANLNDGDEPMPDSDMEKFVNQMAGWMRIGYRQSVKRYYNACNGELAYFFSRIEREVGKLSGDLGQELTITVHPRRLDFKVDVSNPHDDDYYD